jgi:hypothetical protein
MREPLPLWRVLREELQWSILQVDIAPGRTAEIPVRTELLHTPAAKAIIAAIIDKHRQTQDQLREPL